MFKSKSTNMNGGITNAADFQTMGFSGIPDPTYAHVLADDFDFFNASKWAVSGTGAVAPTAVDTLDGGAVLFTTGAVASDETIIQSSGGMQLGGLPVPKATFFKAKFALAEPATTGVYAGIWTPAGTMGSPTNGVWIESVAGSNTLTLMKSVAGAAVSLGTTAFTFAAGVMAEVGFAIDELNNVEWFINPGTGKTGYARNAPSPAGVVAGTASLGRVGQVAGVTLPSAVIVPSFGILTSTAAAVTADLDFLVAVRER